MNISSNNDNDVSNRRFSATQIALGLFGLFAPVLTFFLAVSGLPESVKIFVLVVLAVGYSIVCFWALSRPSTGGDPLIPAQRRVPADIDGGLDSIGEAKEFFGSTLKPADLFRLVSSRVAQVFPFANSALYIATEAGSALQIAQADGPNTDALLGVELPLERGLAGMAWVSKEVEIDVDLKLERTAVTADALKGVRSAVAIPLVHEGQSFAVLVLYTEEVVNVNEALHPTLQAVGDRVAPLFLSSISFERTVSNALTDSITQLPNERAFYMVLENQLAESHRFRNERPLTVLSIDIKNFAETNQNFGYSTGDRMLAFTAEHLISQLRKMDFLSRSANDEFLIILPTASEKFASEIIERIKQQFSKELFAVSDAEEMKVWLNFGWATFWQDGETVEQLLQNARVRKQQAKAEEPSKVLWFPKEYVN